MCVCVWGGGRADRWWWRVTGSSAFRRLVYSAEQRFGPYNTRPGEGRCSVKRLYGPAARRLAVRFIGPVATEGGVHTDVGAKGGKKEANCESERSEGAKGALGRCKRKKEKGGEETRLGAPAKAELYDLPEVSVCGGVNPNTNTAIDDLIYIHNERLQ